MEKIFFGWIHGVWKSTIIKELLKNNPMAWHYSFWENIKDIWEQLGLLKDYKNLSKLQNNDRNIIMKETIKKFEDIVSWHIYDLLLVDNHFSVYQNQKLEKAINDEEIKMYDKFILIEVPREILYQRIVNDKKERILEAFDINNIIRHSEYEREVAFNLVKRLNIELLNIQNIDLKNTIDNITEFINFKNI